MLRTLSRKKRIDSYEQKFKAVGLRGDSNAPWSHQQAVSKRYSSVSDWVCRSKHELGRASSRCSASKGKDAGPFDRAGLQSLERKVGIFELEALGVGPDGDGRRLPQEVQGVLLGVGRHAPEHALPEQLVVIVDRRDR